MEIKLIPGHSEKIIGRGVALVFSLLPGDETFGCGGAIIRHVGAGDPVQVVIVTDGSFQGKGDVDNPDYSKVRRQESIAAARILGYGDPVFLGLLDGDIEYGEKLILQLLKEVEKYEPDLVYLPSIFEMHPDHLALGMSVLEAVRRSKKALKILMYEIGAPLQPNLLLDISDIRSQKQKAMACFESQLEVQDYSEHIQALNRFRTYTLPKTVTAAEAYMVLNSGELNDKPYGVYNSELNCQAKSCMKPYSGNIPLVTIIIRSIGREAYLQEALDSVALQTYPNIEVLIINAKGGGHPDPGEWCGRFPMRICSVGKPLPRSKAANLGLERAKGEYLIFLDDDDLFDPEHLSSLVVVLEKSEGVLAAYSGVRCIGDHISNLSVYNSPFNSARLFSGNYIPIHAVLFHRSVVDSGARFDESLDLYEDWDFWIQVSQVSRFIHVDNISALYRLHEESGSGVHSNKSLVEDSKLLIYRKWRSLWSDTQMKDLMHAADKYFLVEDDPNYHEYAIVQRNLLWGSCDQAPAFSGAVAKALSNAAMVERDAAIARRDVAISDLKDAMKDRDQAIADRRQAIRDRDQANIDRDLALADKGVLANKQAIISAELERMVNSFSFRVTRPLRLLKQLTLYIYHGSRRLISVSARAIWMWMPLPVTLKMAFKGIVFKLFPVFFRNSLAYRSWQASIGVVIASGTNAKSEENNLRTLAEVLAPSGYAEYDLPVPPISDATAPDPSVRLIAFYLPQFHAIPENDEWWGDGFTEWANVRPAVPQFPGHYQPHIPADLGYYDLRNADVQIKQAELAHKYGVEGFCYYFYWFGGKRLLEAPVIQHLKNKKLEIPFCLCWANENWNRRWDGLEDEVLIAQKHSPEDDVAFISYIARYLKDPRYIRVNDRPLLIVYRPALLPSPGKTLNRWRNWCRENGIGEIYLAYTQSFETFSPKKYGFDAAIEFPPNGTSPPLLNDLIDGHASNFSGMVYDWNICLERSMEYRKPTYKLFRSVCPSWDNTPRRGNKGTVFLGSSPGKYRRWLENAAEDTLKRLDNPSEMFVFVNAWNEWAEGAHLEPDQKYGYAYLQATRDALEHVHDMFAKQGIILVAHDAHPHGAQNLILHIAKIMSEDFGLKVDMVVLDGGILLPEFARYAKVHMLSNHSHDGKEAVRLAKDLYAHGGHSAICNTTVTGIFAKTLKNHGFHVTSLIHEMPEVIRQNNLQKCADAIAENVDHIVFPASLVQSGFELFTSLSHQSVSILPQGLFRKNKFRTAAEVKLARNNLRGKLNLPDGAKIVLSVAYADYRKGIDLFVEMSLRLAEQMDDVYFVWVGHFDSAMQSIVTEKVKNSLFEDRFIFPGIDFNSDIYYAGSDVYALTSREDPFPSVVMEALDAGIPVVAFKGATGCEDLLSRSCGKLVPDFSPEVFAQEVINILGDDVARKIMGDSGKKIISDEFSFRHYLFNLLDLTDIKPKRVSVVIPNYNYAKFLPQRIKSVIEQTHPIYELIILDDASSDESLQLIYDQAKELRIDCKVVVNKLNSGNSFLQWLKGAEIATGDYIWIAEADDLSDTGFLSEVLGSFSDQDVVMSYCQSQQINADGRIISNDYLDYVSDISIEQWKKYYIRDGLEEIKSGLSVKNTIPNASAVVFRREPLLSCLQKHIDEIRTLKVAGDWLTYLYVLSEGKISFSPKAFNSHRRHQKGVTIGNLNLSQLKEILLVQQHAQRIVSCDSDVRKKADAYSQSLYEQFGLASKEAPDLFSHPELSALSGGEK